MAVSSSSTTPQVKKYDVFLSFRGVDTRYGFTSHLHAALVREKIETFIDDRLEQGDEISDALLRIIENSMISVIIFSERYGDSRWCLEELVKIYECRKNDGQFIIPVFYHVEPSNVRHQTGNFGNGFDELKLRFMNKLVMLPDTLETLQDNLEIMQDKLEQLRRWTSTLSDVANLSGFDSNVIRNEAELVERIVKCIWKKLNPLSSGGNKELVGVKASIEKIESLLRIESKENLHVVGIWGMGGIGKTSIVRAVFNRIKNQFDSCCFAPSIRTEVEKSKDLNSLRDKLLCAISKDPQPDVNSSFIKDKLNRTKVLIVLDDVTSVKQVEDLIGGFINHFGLGSRIIMTSRDRHVLKSCEGCINYRNIDIYYVEGLSLEKSRKLFERYAFGKNSPSPNYRSLLESLVKYAKGVPLALKELGQFLYNRNESQWKSKIEKLEGSAHEQIQEVLKLSYEELDYNQRNIFLDIACFLRWENKDLVIKFLNANGCHTEDEIEDEIEVLIDKCLITVSDNKIIINDLLQRMGWEIARREFKNLEDRSRLWNHEDILDVLKKNKGDNKIKAEGICLDLSKITYDIHLRQRAFANMNNLRLFKLHNSNCEENNFIKINDFQHHEFDELKYLCWHGCPLNSLQSKFHTENLVALAMPRSHIEQLWTSDQHFHNLRHINLSHSKNLVKITDLCRAPYLETLILEGCTNLLEISCKERLSKLTYLDLGDCESLQSLLPCSLDSTACCWETSESSSGLSPLSTSNLRSSRFNLSNCIKLDQNAVKNIIKDVLQNIEHSEVRSCRTRACICFPGAEIPEWFSYQNRGYSITLKQLPDRSGLKLFVLCAIVEFRNYNNQSQGLEICYDCKNDTRVCHQGTLRGWDYGTGPGCVDLDHIFMGYDFLSYEASDYCNDEMTIQFFVKDLKGNRIGTCEVKKCGFHSSQFQDVGNPTADEGEEQEEQKSSEANLSQGSLFRTYNEVSRIREAAEVGSNSTLK